MIAVIILACIVTIGFFGGMETGLLTADQLVILSKKEKRIVHARAAHYLLIKPERLLSATLIGTNIAVVTATVFIKDALVGAGLPEWSTWIGSLVLTLVVLVLSEIVPKSFFRTHADTLAVKLSPFLLGFYFLILPISFALNFVVRFLLTLLRQKDSFRLPRTREDLRLLMNLVGKETGIKPSGQKIIENILDFRETAAKEVMIPFHNIPMLEMESSIEECISIFEKTGSRYLAVYEGRPEELKGYIDIEKLVSRKVTHIRDILVQSIYYPDTKKIPFLLLSMNYKGLDVVFLSDEYGSISGMITTTQIASEIVGNIPGERLFEVKDIDVISDTVFYISGTLGIEELRNETGISVKKGRYDTIGGYLSDRLGEIPAIGTQLREEGLIFTILDRDEKHIKRIEIKKIRGDARE